MRLVCIGIILQVELGGLALGSYISVSRAEVEAVRGRKKLGQGVFEREARMPFSRSWRNNMYVQHSPCVLHP